MQNPSSISKEPPRFSNLYVFGDSLSDTGNAFQATGGILAASPCGDRRFANELVWIDYLADYLWLSFQPSTSIRPGEGINFAMGGATTGAENLFPATVPNLPELPGLQQQIQTFTASLKRKKADPNALYIIWVGAMDYLPFVNDVPQQTDPSVPISNLTTAVKALAKAGAKHILLVNLPDLAKMPQARQAMGGALLGSSAIASLSTLVVAHNQALAEWIARSRSGSAKEYLPNTNLMGFDVNAVFNEIIADAKHFGFRNTTEAWEPGKQPSEYVFWDKMHPTSKVHQLIARAALEALCESTTLRLVTSCPL
jgi:phospholipase/lecithinase/hemolysin